MLDSIGEPAQSTDRQGRPARYGGCGATDEVKDVAENTQEIAGKVTDQGRQYGEQAQDGEQAQEVAKEARTFVAAP